MVKKNFVLWIVICVLMFGTLNAFTASAESGAMDISVNDRYVCISGEFSSYSGDVQFFIVKEAGNELVYLYQVQSTDGKFFVEFSSKLSSGTYNVTASANDGRQQTGSFTVTPAINTALTTTEYAPWIVNYHLTTQANYNKSEKGGEAGQMVFSAAVSPYSEDLMLVGTDTSGIWRTENGGKSWRISNSGFDIMGAVGIAFHPQNENIVFAAGSPATAGNKTKFTSESGIYKSIDKGITWKQVKNIKYYRNQCSSVFTFGCNANGDSRIYAACSDGIYISDDDGDTWSLSGCEGNTIRSIFQYENYVVASSEQSGVMVSDDYGSSWNAANNGIDDTFVKAFCADAVSGKCYCITDYSLYVSNDMCSSWNKLAANGAISDGAKLERLMLQKDTDGKNILYIGTSAQEYSIRYSEDGGNTFVYPEIVQRAFMSQNYGWYAEAFAFSSSVPGRMLAALDGELFISDDGGKHLYAAQQGYSGMRTYNFSFNGYDNGFLISTVDRGAVESVGTEANSEYPLVSSLYPSGTVRWATRDPKEHKRILMFMGSWTSGSLYEINDRSEPAVILSSNNLKIGKISFHKSYNNIIYAGNHISNDNGKTWIQLAHTVNEVSEVNNDIVYSVENEKEIYRSEDRGATWKLIYTDDVAGIKCITADMNDVYKVYIGHYWGWVEILSGKDSVKQKKIGTANGMTLKYGEGIYSIAQNPHNEKHLVCGGVENVNNTTGSGLFESFDGGENWRNVIGIPGLKDIWTVAFHPNRDQVFIGTSSGTFVYEYKKYSDTSNCYIVNSKNGSLSGKECTVWNLTDKIQKRAMIFALKNKDNGTLLKTEISECDVLPHNTITYSAFTDENTENYDTEAYVWNGITGMVPDVYYGKGLNTEG